MSASLGESHTAIHRMVQRCRTGEYPPLVARVVSGWVVPHLNVMTPVNRERFLADMALVGDAILASTAASRVNYAMFGNLEPALHAHLFPRHAAEPVATRTAQPWALDWTAAPEYSAALHGELQRRIAGHLAKPPLKG